MRQQPEVDGTAARPSAAAVAAAGELADAEASGGRGSIGARGDGAVVTYDGEQNALGERGDDQQAAATTEPGACSMGTEQHSATHGAYRALVGGAGAARGATGDDAQQRELTARLPALAHAAAASSATLAQEEQTGGGDGRTAVRTGAAQTGGTCSADVARMESGANGADCVDIVAAELACVRLDDGAEAARNTRAAATFVPLCVQAPSPAAGAQTRLSSDLHPRLNQRLLGCGHQDDRSEVEPTNIIHILYATLNNMCVCMWMRVRLARVACTPTKHATTWWGSGARGSG